MIAKGIRSAQISANKILIGILQHSLPCPYIISTYVPALLLLYSPYYLTSYC